jgi:hypothetical protein
MISKTLRTVTLSVLALLAACVLAACAGKAPVMEHPVKFYSGSPSRQAMCRRTKEAMAKFAVAIAQHEQTRKYAARVLEQVMAEDPKGEECIQASEKAFGSMIGLTAEDMRVLLQYQENLVYGCAKWKN